MRRLRPILASLGCVLAGGCLYDTGGRYLSGPSGPPTAQVSPEPFATGVPINPRISLLFDRQLDPFEVAPREAVRLTTGRRQMELEVWWDPVDRALHAEPTEALSPGVRYVFEVVDARLLPDLLGRTLGEAAVEELRAPFTVDEAGATREIPPPDVDPSNPEGEFVDLVLRGPGGCAGCHTGGALYPGTTLALDEMGALAGRPATTSPGRTLVVPGQPERSYLLHKLLEDYPDIGGETMPPGARLSPDDRRRALRATQAWIRALPNL